jgi:hypothetical protein
MIIDFHTHCFHDSIASAAIGALERCARIEAAHDGTAGGLKSHMSASGVDKCVVLPVATKPSQVSVINSWAKDNSDATLCFFGALHPDDPDWQNSLVQLKKSGFKGVKLHPDYQRFFADEPRMMPIYEALRDLKLILVLHAGVDIGYPAPVHCTPLMIRRVIRSIPGLCLVAAHMGAHALWRDVEDVLLGLPVFLDTSYSHYSLQNDGMTRMIRRHGSENVLFGTDSPWKRADDEISSIRSLDLPAADIERILSQNAYALLAQKP